MVQQRCDGHSRFGVDCLEILHSDILLSSSSAKSPLPCSTCCLENTATVPPRCPRGVLTEAFPSSVFSEAHTSSRGSGLDMGAFHRPTALARTCPCFRNQVGNLACVFSLGSKQPLTQNRFICSRGGITSAKSTSVALAVGWLMPFLIPSCQYLEFAGRPQAAACSGSIYGSCMLGAREANAWNHSPTDNPAPSQQCVDVPSPRYLQNGFCLPAST